MMTRTKSDFTIVVIRIPRVDPTILSIAVPNLGLDMTGNVANISRVYICQLALWQLAALFCSFRKATLISVAIKEGVVYFFTAGARTVKTWKDVRMS